MPPKTAQSQMGKKRAQSRLSRQSSGPSTRRQKKNLPIAEIVTGIALLWIFSGAGFPKVMSYFQSNEIKNQAEQIYYDLESAKLTALTKNINMVMSFDPENSQYSMHSDLNSNGRVDPGEPVQTKKLDPEISFHTSGTEIMDVWGHKTLSKNPILFSDQSRKVTFFPSGQASADGAIYLTRKADIGKTAEYMRAIQILKTTGKIQVMQYKGDDASPWQ